MGVQATEQLQQSVGIHEIVFGDLREKFGRVASLHRHRLTQLGRCVPKDGGTGTRARALQESRGGPRLSGRRPRQGPCLPRVCGGVVAEMRGCDALPETLADARDDTFLSQCIDVLRELMPSMYAER